jgi:hypothetical protein
MRKDVNEESIINYIIIIEFILIIFIKIFI